MIDAVLGVDTNPLMSGIGAFNFQLAQRLGVPCASAAVARSRTRFQAPLLSLRGLEFVNGLSWPTPYDVFYHSGFIPDIVSEARRVYAANAELAERIRPIRPDVIAAHCPGLIVNRGAFPKADITVFSFGHGHKLRTDLYTRLKELLDATGESYTVYLSAGLHTGARVVDDPFLALEQLFGDRLIFLGILSDRAVAHYLATSTYVVCFFEKGVRENNTTVNAALDAGAAVITNCDAWTPPTLRGRVHDLAAFSCPLLPSRGLPSVSAYTWDGLLKKLR